MQPDVHNLPHTQSWALATGATGQILIGLSLVCFLAAAINLYLPFKALGPKLSTGLFWVGAFGLFGAIICLGTLFAKDQFGFNYVFGHSDADVEFKYKIAGIWAGQQGSFLLWACTASLFGLLAMPKDGPYRKPYQLFFCVFLACLCGILSYETPFEVMRSHGVALTPPKGFGLVASLQNYWVVIHPPTIFMGFGSLTVAAAYGFSAMISGNLKDWVPMLRPWAILSTSILGIGLCMGGFWAYETLGWGGFWAWDPVENVSFVPWVFNIALIHGLLVQQAKKTWYGSTLILAGLPFFIFCYGTFLTRSGFLTEASVHSFAQMNTVALWILAIFVVLGTATYFIIYAAIGRKLANALKPAVQPEEALLTREKAYAGGILLLCGLAASTAVGMSIPFFLGMLHRNSKVVEEPLYHKVVGWFFVPIMILMAIAPFISWRPTSWAALWTRLSLILAASFGLTGAALLCFKFSGWGIDNPVWFLGFTIPALPWITFLVGLCIFAAIANIWRIVETYRASKLSIGGFIAHIGLAMLMSGLIISRGLERKEEGLIKENEASKVLDYSVTYKGMSGQDLAWDDPVAFHMGETKAPTNNGVSLTFKGLSQTGKENELAANVLVDSPDADGKWHTKQFSPMLVVENNKQNPIPIPLGKNLQLAFYRYEVKTDTAYFQVFYDPNGLFDRDNKATFQLARDGEVFNAKPGIYYEENKDPNKPVLWPALTHHSTEDVYFTLYTPQINVWDTPIPFAVGETKDPDNKGVRVTYKGFDMAGAAGAAGRKFTANVTVDVQDNNKEWHTYDVHPSIELTSDGPQSVPAAIDREIAITLSSIDPKDHSAQLQVVFSSPIFPIDLFYKPMVILVWLGAGVMTLGGLISAIYRRTAKTTPKAKISDRTDEEVNL